MAIYQEDVIRLDLNRACFHRSFLNHTLGTNDISGNRFGLILTKDGVPIDATLISCIGYFIRADGETVVVNGGLADENGVLGVTLPQACYAVLGQFTLILKICGGDPGVTGTIRVIDGTVTETTTGTIVDPGTIVPQLTVEAIVAKIAECEAAAQQAGLMVQLIEKLGLYVDSEGYTCQKLSGES